jgi:hypothetical protein
MFFKKQDLPEVEFPNSIEIDGNTLDVEINYSKKGSSSVSIKENKLVFRMSSYLNKNLAKEHFNSLLEKITKKIKKDSGFKILTFEEVFERGYFDFAGQRFEFEYTKNRGVKLKENIFYVNFHTKIENLKKQVPKLLIEKYKPRVEAFLQAVNSETYKYLIKDFHLKLVDSKWGHCTPHNDVMLNLKLLNADIEILRYVIIHELAHVRHKNHSMKFWNEVAKYCPNYKVLRKTLKENPPRLYY